MDLNTKIAVADLLDKLRTNRAEHIELHKKALTRWEEVIVKELEKALARAKRKKTIDPYFLSKFPMPVSYETSFDQVIEMLDNDTRTEIEISASDFQQYWRNQWSWTNSFTTSNATYGVK